MLEVSFVAFFSLSFSVTKTKQKKSRRRKKESCQENQRNVCRPCSRPISDDDPHDFCVECLGETHTLSALEDAECEHCEIFPVKVHCSRLAYVRQERACASSMMHLWGLRVDLCEEQDTGPSLSLALSPDCVVRKPASVAHTGASSDRAEDTSSLGEIDVKWGASECSSRIDLTMSFSRLSLALWTVFS